LFILRRRESEKCPLAGIQGVHEFFWHSICGTKQPSFLCTERKQMEKNGNTFELLIV